MPHRSVQPQFTQETASDGTTFATIDGDVQTANGYRSCPARRST
jgi:hypothetical protein